MMGDFRSFSISKMMGCCSCFGFINKPKRRRAKRGTNNSLSRDPLLDGETDGDEVSSSGEVTSITTSGDDNEVQGQPNRSEAILYSKAENGMICRRFPVKETNKLVRS